ncbi:MAG: EAL domain-containing protein [Gallionella sp.]|nr:EAL domain-containing protein [Gallionella sp.]
MNRKHVQPDADQLRRAAEAKLAGEQLPDMPDRSAKTLLHELHVHQIELEMQNETLRRAHIEMEASRDRYVDLYDFSPVSYLTLSSAGTITEANLTAADLFAAERRKLIKRRFANFVVPEDVDHWHQYFLRVQQSDKPQNCELSLRRADGFRFDVHLNAQRMENGRGGYTVRVALTDITEARQIEADLRRLHEMEAQAVAREKEEYAYQEWVNAMNAVNDPIFLHDREFRVLRCNKAYQQCAALPLKQIIGQRYYEIFPITHAPACDCLQTLENAEAENKEEMIGDTSFRSRAFAIHDAQGIYLYSVHIMEDITERKKAMSKQNIAAIVFEAQEGMLVTDANGMILTVNRSFTKITGYLAEEVIGKNPRILSSGRHDKNFYDAMWASLNHLGYWEGEIWNKRKNGEAYPEHLCITAVKDKEGVIKNYVATLTDIIMNRDAAEEIQHLAFYDTLTRLPNRRLLLERLKLAQVSSTRTGHYGAILFLDLDNFKALNDTLGHDIGDLLLQAVAQRLESCVREGDTVSRLGGDEFVVIINELSDQDLEAAAQSKAVGEKILNELNLPYQLASYEHRSTPSIGVNLFVGHTISIEELLKQSDIAMYQAKKNGRNTLQFFDPAMQESIIRRARMETQLQTALEKRQFQLYYQVQVDSDGRALGAEVLIRWNHPERGVIHPVQFIPLAEETGQILPIGHWVLDTACAQLALWQQNDLTRHLTLSVNVSARQFHQDNFVGQVRQVLLQHAINPAKLKLEPTESILLENIEEAVETMNALKKLGVQFALDDFGTGFSSLQYLKRLPLNQLKIDQSFVRDLVSGENDQAIVRTIIAMAHGLNLDVIAEGVETKEQLQILQENGCQHFQGYLFGNPVPIEQFELPPQHE